MKILNAIKRLFTEPILADATGPIIERDVIDTDAIALSDKFPEVSEYIEGLIDKGERVNLKVHLSATKTKITVNDVIMVNE